MVEITDNGKKALKLIFTDFLMNYNSYNIKDKLGLSNAGSLKLLRSLHGKNLLLSNKMGNAIFYKVNLKNEYALKLLELIFMERSGLSAYVLGWMEELRAFIPFTKAILLFGSLLRKGKEAQDVDVCFILKDMKNYDKVRLKIKELNAGNRLKIHPLYITEDGFNKKLEGRDKPLVEVVKSCVVVYGQDAFVRILKNVNS